MPRLSEGGYGADPGLDRAGAGAEAGRDRRAGQGTRPTRKDQGLYDSDYAAMEELKKIADEYGLAIVVIHHLTEDGRRRPARPGQRHDRIVRLGGHRAGAESDRLRHVTLHGRGRDIEDIEKAVQFDRGTCTWTVLGEAGSVQFTGERAAFLLRCEKLGGRCRWRTSRRRAA